MGTLHLEGVSKEEGTLAEEEDGSLCVPLAAACSFTIRMPSVSALQVQFQCSDHPLCPQYPPTSSP